MNTGKTPLAFRVPKKCANPLLKTGHTTKSRRSNTIPPMQSVIGSFKNYLYEVGYGEGTRKMLPALVREFMQHQNITDISCIGQQQVRSFYGYLQVRPLQKRSGALSEMMISHYMYALKTFFNWAEATEQIAHNPMSGMKFKRPKQNIREPLSKAAVQELFTAATTLKQRALLHIFYSCGLRRSEGEALNTGDVHFKQRLLYVRAGKGAKRRVVPMTEKVSRELEGYYLNERKGSTARKAKDEDAFLLSSTGTRMRGNGLYKLLKTLLDKAGISKEVTLHHLRHSIATHLLQGGMSMEYVRDFLGHRHLESTQVYAKPTWEQLKIL